MSNGLSITSSDAPWEIHGIDMEEKISELLSELDLDKAEEEEILAEIQPESGVYSEESSLRAQLPASNKRDTGASAALFAGAVMLSVAAATTARRMLSDKRSNPRFVPVQL